MESFTLLFDLDGTLVNTDNIYCEVWNELLKDYDLTCNMCFFNNFIKGKNDALFLKYLIPNISSNEITNISFKKDELFIKKIETNKPQILILGAYEFIENYKNNNIAIVTSCNKKSALYILQYTNIYQFTKLLITADDCNNHKPHPEPYLKAIDYFNADKNKCIIFEDSYSGFTSAINSGVPNICIIKNEDTCKELLVNDYYKILNYNNINFENIIKKNCNNDCIVDKIKNLLNCYPNLNVIKYNNENIKCGYICDIQRMKLLFNNNDEDEVIIKISNLDNNGDIVEKMYSVKRSIKSNKAVKVEDTIEDNILVSGSHLVYDTAINQFIHVKDLACAEVSNVNCSVLYCLITTDHTIQIGDWIFHDWEDSNGSLPKNIGN